MELWQTTAQELDLLQQTNQKNISDGQIHDTPRQQLKDQLVQFQQHTHKLQVANQKRESTNQQFLKTLTEQSTEMEVLQGQLSDSVCVCEKASRLQKRLTQAEQKATTATQQLTMLAPQRRRAALVDPETL
ncbi:sodium channel and clathrin linker 1-like [Pungitius pungitius]|uniref:sodium channel and clathrin linker 1-like n=1 Tax=Pungitius pungitius TaxID=134920 RepID=UPI002E15BE39